MLNLFMINRPAVVALLTACLSLASVGSVGCVSSATDRVDGIRSILLDPTDPRVLIVAHRGHHADAPENSAAAIRAAYTVGAHMAEVDVRVTRDGKFILLHDWELWRTATSWKTLGDYDLDGLRQLRLLQGIRPTAHRIPTLDEALSEAKGRVMLNLDPKGVELDDLIEAVRSRNMLDHVLFKASKEKLNPVQFEHYVRTPDLMFMPIIRTEAEVDELVEWSTVHPGLLSLVELAPDMPSDRVAPSIVALKSAGMRVWVNALWAGPADEAGDWYAIDDPAAVYAALIEMGIGIIQTDLPDLAIRSRGSM